MKRGLRKADTVNYSNTRFTPYLSHFPLLHSPFPLWLAEMKSGQALASGESGGENHQTR